MKLVKGYVAASDIDGYKIVKLNAQDALEAAASRTDKAVGVVGQRGGLEGQHVSVTHAGEEFVRIGAAVEAGDRFVSNGDGDAIPLPDAVAADTKVHYAGIIIQSSSDVGAVVRCVVSPGSVIY